MLKLENIALIVSLTIVLVITFAFFSLPEKEVNKKNYSLTRAICENNTCRDYLISCSNNGTLISSSPITGFVTFPIAWNDTRAKKEPCKN